MTTQRGNRSISVPFLEPQQQMGVSGHCHASAALLAGKTRYLLNRRLVGPQSRSGWVENISPPPGFDSQTVQPIASCYTNYAIPAYSLMCSFLKCLTVMFCICCVDLKFWSGCPLMSLWFCLDGFTFFKLHCNVVYCIVLHKCLSVCWLSHTRSCAIYTATAVHEWVSVVHTSCID
jgi:hypothetical protein